MKAKLMIIAAGLLGLAVLSLAEEALARQTICYNAMNTRYCETT